MNIWNILIVTLFMCFFNPAYAEKLKKLTQQDFALKVCLDDNYEKINAYQREGLKDYSSFNIRLPEQQIALSNFVKANTGYFYKESLPIHIESRPPPYHAIFQRCMEFYKSEKLRKFVQKNKY